MNLMNSLLVVQGIEMAVKEAMDMLQECFSGIALLGVVWTRLEMGLAFSCAIPAL